MLPNRRVYEKSIIKKRKIQRKNTAIDRMALAACQVYNQ